MNDVKKTIYGIGMAFILISMFFISIIAIPEYAEKPNRLILRRDTIDIGYVKVVGSKKWKWYFIIKEYYDTLK